MNDLFRWQHPDRLKADRYENWLSRIDAVAKGLGARGDWVEYTGELRRRLEEGAELNSLLPDAFAAVREVADQTLDMRHYDEQLVGGMLLHDGFALEMETGEGKTLVATLPAYLQALGGGKTLIVTLNDYLARRDMGWMSPIYRGLGLSVGLVTSYHFPDRQLRKYSYDADVVYVTAAQLAWDYLQDHTIFQRTETCLGQLSFALIDEVDLILLEYATQAFVVPGEASDWIFDWRDVRKIVMDAREGEEADYYLHRGGDGVEMSDSFVELLGQWSRKLARGRFEGDGDDQALATLIHQVKQMILAGRLKENDDYLIDGGKVIVIDREGRRSDGRFPAGRHEALETLHGITPGISSTTSATISYQALFKKFGKRAGMSSTVHDSRDELHRMYGLSSAGVRPHRTLGRTVHDDRFFVARDDKLRAVTELISDLHARRAPILVGGPSAAENIDLAARVVAAGVHEDDLAVLDARNVASEAIIVSEAGKPGRVTIATNMAGRGTDIVLGGDPRVLLERLEHVEGEIDGDRAATIRSDCERARDEVIAGGGLHVVLLQRQRNARADKHFMGRCARQGDPGQVYPFACLADGLFDSGSPFTFDPDPGLTERLPPGYRTYVRRRQEHNEREDYRQRSVVWVRDNALSEGRDHIYALRTQILHLDMDWDSVDWAFPVRAAQLEIGHAGDSNGAPSFPEFWLAQGIRHSLDAVGDPYIVDEDELQALVTTAFGDAIGARYRMMEANDQAMGFATAVAGSVIAEIRSRLSEFHDKAVAAEFLRVVALDCIDNTWQDLLSEYSTIGDSIRIRALTGGPNVVHEIQDQQMRSFATALNQMQSRFVQLLVHGVPKMKLAVAHETKRRS